MRILDRYIVREVFRHAVLGLSSLLLFYSFRSLSA